MTRRADELARAVQNVLDKWGYIDISNTNGYDDHGKICRDAAELGEELDELWPDDDEDEA